MKKLICILMCILLCGCALNEQSDAVVSGDVIDDDNIIVEDIEEKSYSFEQIEMPDGIKLDYFWSDGLYRDAENNDEEGKAILYLHRDGLFEKLERIKYGGVDEFGKSTDQSFIWSTADGEFVWFLGLVGEYSGKYLYNNEFISSIYLLDENGAENLLDETHGIVEIDYLSDNSQICGKMIVYTSDCYVANGETFNCNSIWVYNLETREEYRIDFENEYNDPLDPSCWLDEDTLIFRKGNEFFIHKSSMGAGYEPFYTVDSEMYTFRVSGTHLWLFEKNGFGVKVIELDSMTEHYFDLSVEISVQDSYDETKYLATSEDQKEVILIDLETDTFEMFEWDMDTYIEYAYFIESGDDIVIEESDMLQDATNVLGIYKLLR